MIDARRALPPDWGLLGFEERALLKISDLAFCLQRYVWRVASEVELQEAVWRELERCQAHNGGSPPRREVELSSGGRIDFVWHGSIGIELKTRGGLGQVTEQLFRYAAAPELVALVLVTTSARLRAQPPTMRSKPLRVIYLRPF